MSISQTILQHLPHLRRFARALCGSQASGDAYVASLLEILSDDPESFPKGMEPRPALYQAFLKVWGSIPINLEGSQPEPDANASVDRKLEGITPLPRQAFLLQSVEGFSTEEAAQILDMPVLEVVDLIDEAGKQIAEEIATDVLIIEDEPMIAFDLGGIVESLGHRVTAIARTKADALRAARADAPGLVLADIQLADGTSGIDAVNELLESFEVPVIFITAFPERLLTGERPEPTFLITKPYRPETVKAMISQSLFFEQKAHRLRLKRSAAGPGQ